MSTDKYASMFLADYQFFRRGAKGGGSRDNLIRTVNDLERGNIKRYRVILQALGYEGSLVEARRVFLNRELRDIIDNELAAWRDEVSRDELIQQLDLIIERRKGKER